MDFTTRDSYRHVIDKMSKVSHLSEIEIANIAIQLASDNATKHGISHRTAHVGYYLIDKGVQETRRLAKSSSSLIEIIKRVCSQFTLFLYLGTATFFTILFTVALLSVALINGLPQAWLIPMAI